MKLEREKIHAVCRCHDGRTELVLTKQGLFYLRSNMDIMLWWMCVYVRMCVYSLF